MISNDIKISQIQHDSVNFSQNQNNQQNRSMCGLAWTSSATHHTAWSLAWTSSATHHTAWSLLTNCSEDAPSLACLRSSKFLTLVSWKGKDVYQILTHISLKDVKSAFVVLTENYHHAPSWWLWISYKWTRHRSVAGHCEMPSSLENEKEEQPMCLAKVSRRLSFPPRISKCGPQWKRNWHVDGRKKRVPVFLHVSVSQTFTPRCCSWGHYSLVSLHKPLGSTTGRVLNSKRLRQPATALLTCSETTTHLFPSFVASCCIITILMCVCALWP